MAAKLQRETQQAGEENKQRVDHNDNQPELGGPQLGVRQPELTLEVGVDTDIDGQEKIQNEHRKGEVQIHQRRQAGTDEHEGLVDTVHRVVEVVAVEGPLAVAHTRQGAVERVAVPVDHQSRRTQPQPANAVVREGEPQAGEERSEDTHHREHVGGDPLRLPPGKPHQGFLLHPVEERGLYAQRLLDFAHIVSLYHLNIPPTNAKCRRFIAHTLPFEHK